FTQRPCCLNHVPFTMLREPNFDSFRNWRHGTRLFDQSFGMPQIPDKWSHWPGSHWPSYMCPPGSSVDVGFYFYCLMVNPYTCTISRHLDVNQFAPEELMVKAKDRESWMAGSLASVMYWAVLTTLCTVLRSYAEQLPYQAVTQPVRMPSMVQL
uniref:Uncharacterized protein n=1 Tax=Salmo trutta TaxID=8032 RepID=A0A674EJT4_SALTR